MERHHKNQSKLQCYLALNRQNMVADYLTTVTDRKLRKTLTRYRLSEHSLAIETGRHRQTWLPREDSLAIETGRHRQTWLSREDSLAIETGRHRQTWLPREDRLCSLCSRGEVETELHFLLHCDKYSDLREYFFPKIIIQYKEFETIKDEEKIKYLLGEKPMCSFGSQICVLLPQPEGQPVKSAM